MNRKPTTPPVQTWQFFSACIYHLGKSYLTKLFQRSTRQIERWAADPDTTTSQQRNSVDRYEALLVALMERGKIEVARAVVARQAAIVGCALTESGDIHPDKSSIEAECLDDYPPITEFHNAIREAAPPDVIKYLASKAKLEIDETVHKATMTEE